MPLKIIQGDINQLKVDGMVDPTYKNHFLLESEFFIDEIAINHHNTIDSNILTHAAIIKNPEGLAPFKIYVVGPHFYKGLFKQNIQLLKESYLNCLMLASKHQLQSIAFPLISSGGKKFPKKLAFEVAKHTIEGYLIEYDLDVTLVVYDIESILFAEKYLDEVKAYITSRYQQPSKDPFPKKPDKAFHEKLIQMIHQKEINDVKMYQSAHLSKAHFHKLITGKSLPSRKTALLLVIAMRLNIHEAIDLLKSAGFTFSNTSHFDLIVEYHIKSNIYDLDQIDQTLFQYTSDTLRKYD